MITVIDILRLMSMILAGITIYFLIHFWKKFTRFQPQFYIILVYLAHGILFYAALFATRFFTIPMFTNQFFNDWGAVLRFHSYTSWFFVALLYFRVYRRWNG